MNAMYCGRCDCVYATTKLVCSECGFVMVGVIVDEHGEARRCPPPPPPPTRLPMPGSRPA